MKLDDIITLINAGYTKEEIQALEQPADPEPTQTEPVQPEDPPAKAPAADPGQSVQTAQTPPQDPILEAINKLTSAVMAKNLNTTTAETLTAQTTQDILAKVIAPPKPQKKG